ncbi:MAG: endo alpha-1,4 polygalactosaminidase [Rhodospirillaceae bacterium]|nr:endo alpha-1,4 polygalactosaminidase [Rhodospirillaceae bacterium]
MPLLFVGALTVGAAAQQRQLGPPPGAGAGLEGSEPSEPAPKAEDVPVVPAPPPKARATTRAPEVDTSTERTRMLLGEVEILDMPLQSIPNYRDYMRTMIEDLSIYAHGRNPKFVVVTEPGFDLTSWSRREFDLEEIKRDRSAKISPDSIVPVGTPMRRYLQRIDGLVLDGQFCAPLRVPRADLAAMMKQGLKMLSVDHCADAAQASAALQAAVRMGVVAHIDLDANATFDRIPTARPSPENSGNVEGLADARNMLVMLDSKAYGSKEEWVAALSATNYDVIITDAFYKGNLPLSKDAIHSLKFKQMGARRLVLARLSLGYAEDERYYWQRDWKIGAPSWIQARVPGKPGSYVVEFWNPAWKAIVGKYFAGIMDLGFDGVVLDGVEAYRRYEFMTPIDAPTGG